VFIAPPGARGPYHARFANPRCRICAEVVSACSSDALSAPPDTEVAMLFAIRVQILSSITHPAHPLVDDARVHGLERPTLDTHAPIAPCSVTSCH
jgi:hypothetical protein